MSFRSLLATLFTPDPPVQLNADWFLDKADRQRLDDQIRSLQTQVVNSLRGQHTTELLLHSSSASGAVGECVCVGPSATTEDDPMQALRYATRARLTGAGSGPIADAGVVLGVIVAGASPGAFIRVATGGIVGPQITGLASGNPGPVKLNTSTARCQRVTAYVTGDYPVGFVDALGNLTLVKGLVIP